MANYEKLKEEVNEEPKEKANKLTPEQLAEMNTPESGLTSSEAARRLARDGPNMLPEKKVNPFLKFLSYFWGPMPGMIWAAILIELIRLSWLDFGVLMILQFVNGFVGWYEEKNAGNAIEALKKNMAPKAKCKRDGQYDTINAKDLVIGDRINLKLGDIIPADAVLGPGFAEIDQSALTGESLAVMKYEGDTVYQGSVCKRGDLEAIVMATGARTFFGRTSALVGSVNQRGNFQKVLLKVAFSLLIVSVVLVIVILIVNLAKGNNFLETLSICVVLLVASIPIAMQVVCTATMAVGAHALATRKAIVSRLTAIEELAGMKILCSDKTGTLTKNELTIQNPVLLKNYKAEDLFLVAGLAAKREVGSQDAIDKCITEYAYEKCRISYDGYEEEEFIPFDPKIKRTEATVRNRKGEIFRCTKGAPQVVLAMAADPSIEEEVSGHVLDLAARGYRTLGVAKMDPGETKWKMIGLISLYDPPRDDTKETIQKALQMEVKVKMITGDQLAIAKETARLLNMGDKIYNSDMLQAETNTVSREILDSMVEEADGFAEVFPEHKFAIVKMLQERGFRCGMTGDGVNDAPALKKADVGIAVDGATDAARAAADIVLTSPGLSVIIEAIYRARKTFQRMNNYCTYRIACTFQIIIFFFITMVAVDPSDDFTCKGHGCGSIPNTFALPVICLVIMVILNDGLIISIAYDKVTVNKKPEAWNMVLIFSNSTVLGFIAFISSLILLLLCLDNMNSHDKNVFLNAFGIEAMRYGEILTIIFMKVSISNFLTVFSARTMSWFWTRMPGKLLFSADMFGIVVCLFLSCYWFLNISVGESSNIPDMKPISWGVAMWVLGYDLVFFILQDIAKIIMIRAFDVYYKSQGKEGGYSGAMLGESFLMFSDVVTDRRSQRKSIVTRRSMVAAQDVHGGR